jgi:rubrerythrin
MSDLTDAGNGAADDVVAPQAEGAISVTEAASILAKARTRQAKEAAAPKEAAAAPAEAPQELAETPNSDPPKEVPAETTEAPEPEETPPIDAPKSWTKDAKEQWQSLPREAQEIIAQREQERDSAIRRSQNEAAEKLKGLTAKEQQAEQLRQQYENALPMLLQNLQQAQQGEFADIKTMSDVEKLAREDWPRYALWDAQQKKIAAVQQEMQSAQTRQAQEFESKWNEFATKEDQTLIEKAPELADKARSGKVGDKALEILHDNGFSDQDLAALWNGKASLSLRDHRLQLLILDAVKYREAKANVAKPTPKPVPPVQRPGVAGSKGASVLAAVDKARERLSTARGNQAIDAAYQLLQARRAARG